MIRVIAGEAKGRKLKMVDQAGLRPSSARVREALFSSLGSKVHGARVLDLYAGSGALGIEALSRGAAHATFVEKSAKAVGVIEANLESTGLADRGVVVHLAAEYFADRPTDETYGLVLIDPPYDLGIPADVLNSLRRWEALEAECVLVVEAATRSLPLEPPEGFVLSAEKRYGDSALLYIKEA